MTYDNKIVIISNKSYEKGHKNYLIYFSIQYGIYVEYVTYISCNLKSGVSLASMEDKVDCLNVYSF